MTPPVVQITCRPVKTPEVVPALRMILANDGQLADESQAVELMKFTAQRGINLADIWVCQSNGQLLWAALPVVNPGRTVLYFGTSAGLMGPDLSAMEAGIESICRHYGPLNIQLAQVLLDPEDIQTIDVYVRHDFKIMAELHYLQRTVRRAATPTPLPADFKIANYSQATHAGFAAAILASYEQSLDCPPLNGMRSIQDIIAGHKSAGIFDPNDWYLLSYANQPVAVLLLSMTHQMDGLELVYLGLSPQIRGAGLGNYLMQLAESRVVEKRVNKLSLAVDAKNQPALKLYYRHGMKQVTKKLALMRELDPTLR